jgi:hypothetical protein
MDTKFDTTIFTWLFHISIGHKKYWNINTPSSSIVSRGLIARHNMITSCSLVAPTW